MSLFEASTAYKPFRYPFAFTAYLLHRRAIWIPEEVVFDRDIVDWNEHLTERDKNCTTQVFRFFVQADLDIAQAYLERYIPVLKPAEIRMMLSDFASREALHMHAYSMLLDTVGMPEVEYQAFAKYKAMSDKHAYFYQNREGYTELERLALDLAIFSAFGEGMQLFSSFAILLNFSRPGNNKLTQMGRIVTWSIRDESIHVEAMIKVFHTLLDENPQLWTDKLKADIYQACRDMVALEDTFIDLAFELGDLEGLTKEDVKQYIRYIADRRLLQLYLKPNYGVKVNPLPWIEDMLNLDEFANFFETEVTEYSSASLSGEWGDIDKQDLYSTESIQKFFSKRKMQISA